MDLNDIIGGTAVHGRSFEAGVKHLVIIYFLRTTPSAASFRKGSLKSTFSVRRTLSEQLAQHVE